MRVKKIMEVMETRLFLFEQVNKDETNVKKKEGLNNDERDDKHLHSSVIYFERMMQFNIVDVNEEKNVHSIKVEHK